MMDSIWAALESVNDPEIPVISVVEMGMIAGFSLKGASVHVQVTPTFVGCPALDIIRANIEQAVLTVPGVTEVSVSFVFDPPWTSSRITRVGQAKLAAFGIAPPGSGLVDLEFAPACPYCGSQETHLENLFGPTACRSIFYCDGCRQPFEAMKPI